MTAHSPAGFLGSIFKQLRKLTHSVHDKPSSAVDECELEHLLIYHGLVGTSPENQRAFRDVRADIAAAVRRRSSLDLAIALKLPPLWWEEKLKTIFGELIETDREGAILTLLPAEEDDLPDNVDPLANEDWRVRANAANMLAFLNAGEGSVRIARALSDSAAGSDSLKPSFPYLAFSLGALRTDHARETLKAHLHSAESWFRVDTVRALCLWDDRTTTGDVMRSMLSHHTLSDYAAVAIARQRSVAELIATEDEEIRAGTMETILGVVAAAEHTFPVDTVVETRVHSIWKPLRRVHSQFPSIRSQRALTALARWLKNNRGEIRPAEIVDERGGHPTLIELLDECELVLHGSPDGSADEALIARLKASDPAGSPGDSELRHIIQLAAERGLKGTAPHLVSMLAVDSPLIDDVVDALGAIGDKSAVPALLVLAGQVVDLDERTASVLSAHPVFEREPVAARTYWCVLRALGNLEDQTSTTFLLRATADVAPDKREQALSALIKVSAAGASPAPPTTREAVDRALTDPAPSVRMVALNGVESLGLFELVPGVVRLTDVKAVSLRTRAFEVLQALAVDGHSAEVKAAVGTRLRTELDQHKRARLEKFLSTLTD